MTVTIYTSRKKCYRIVSINVDYKSACVASLAFEYEILIGLERESYHVEINSWITTHHHLVDQNFWICTYVELLIYMYTSTYCSSLNKLSYLTLCMFALLYKIINVDKLAVTVLKVIY